MSTGLVILLIGVGIFGGFIGGCFLTAYQFKIKARSMLKEVSDEKENK